MPSDRSSVAIPEAQASVSSWLSRRVGLRYPIGPSTGARVSTEDPVFRRRVRVHDVSQHGMALLLPEALPLGQEVYIQISNRDLRLSYDLGAEVRHSTPHKRNRWIVGLRFHQELTPEELASLL